MLSIGKDYYRVVGFRTEIWRYKDEAWEDVIYELARIKDDDWLECSEDEMILVAEAKDADLFLKKQNLSPTNKSMLPKPFNRRKKPITTEITVKALTEIQKKEKIDRLLDLYYDYRCLKLNFGDEEFNKVLEMIVKKLKMLTTVQ